MLFRSGTGFVPGCTVEINGLPVSPTSTTATAITFAYPPGIPCGSSVAVRNPDGRAATSALNPTPVVTSTSLGSGPAAGNAIFVINGNGFAPGTTVTIGGAAATVTSATAILVVLRTPPGTPGVAPVVVTTPGGCQTTTTYTYQ